MQPRPVLRQACEWLPCFAFEVDLRRNSKLPSAGGEWPFLTVLIDQCGLAGKNLC